MDFTQLRQGILYAYCYGRHCQECTGRPLNRKDFAVLACAVGLGIMVSVYLPLQRD